MHAGGRGRWALCAGGVGGVGDAEGDALLCMLEAMEGGALFAGSAGDDTLCATLYARGRGRWVLFAGSVGGVRGAGDDVPCAAPYVGGRRRSALFVGGAGGDAPCAALLSAAEGRFRLLEVMCRVLLCMLEAVEGQLCLLVAMKVMRCVLLCMLEAVEGELCLLEVLEVLAVLEAMRCMILCRYAVGCGGWAQFRGFEISIAAVISWL